MRTGHYGGDVNEPMTPERRHQRAHSFGPAALLYDEVRPTYPPAAVTWALEPLGPVGMGGWRVADVGAGTGIMTRVLRSLGHRAVAIEPDPLMRQRLAETTDAQALGGSAEVSRSFQMAAKTPPGRITRPSSRCARSWSNQWYA